MRSLFKVKRMGISRGRKLYESLHEQIQAYVSRGIPSGTGCLIYPTTRRYPSMRYDKKQKNFGQWLLISRGISDPNIVARHICDNTRCVNPQHVIAGTQFDNVQDLLERGRPNGILRGIGRPRKKVS